MASSTHVDSRVAERRLRPIYDWLELGNNKKALQEAEKVLKKQPNFLCAKVLKALALQRLGKDVECEELLEAVYSQVPTDDATLQAMTICYRAIHKPDKICEVYTAAAKKDPTNEELLTHLFMSYVRVGDYKKQHQYALALYKLKPKNPYFFWAVMSLVMQAKSGNDVGKTVALKLAEKMVTKFVEEDKIEAEQEIHLYLMILEMQGKYDEALDVIEGNLGDKLKSYILRETKKIELLIKLERWKQVNTLLKLQLETNCDNWSDYKLYMQSMLKLFDMHNKTENSIERSNNYEENGDAVDDTPSLANNFFLSLIDNLKNQNKKVRGPYLAQIELYSVLSQSYQHIVNPSQVVGNICDLLVNYFKLFGDKPVCITDLRSYLSLLSQNESCLFMQRVSDIVGLEDGQSPNSLISIQKHISRLLFSRALGFHKVLTIDERLSFCDLLINHYESGKKFIDEAKLPTEFRENDAYIIVTSHVLYSLYQDTGNSFYLRRAIYHLEEALTTSSSNFNFKLLLIKYLLLLGAGTEAFLYHDLLDVKHIQLETLGYLFISHIYSLGHYSIASTAYDATLKFYLSNTNDSVDHLTYSYKFGSFVKIEDFINFRNKLNNSLHFALISCEKLLMDVLHTNDTTTTTDPFFKWLFDADWETYNDNRDFSIITDYQNQLTNSFIQDTFQHVKCYTQLRVLLLKCLIHNSYSQFYQFYDTLDTDKLYYDHKAHINAPIPTKLESFLKLPYKDIVRNIEELSNSVETKQEEQVTTCLCEILSLTRNTINKLTIDMRRESDDVYSKQLDKIQQVTCIVEMIAVVLHLTNNIKTRIKTSNSDKKSKKKKENVCFQKEFNTFLTDLEICIKDLEQSLDCLIITQTNTDSVDIMLLEMKHLNISYNDTRMFAAKNLSVIDTRLMSNYTSSVQEIREVIQDKINYLQSLKT